MTGFGSHRRDLLEGTRAQSLVAIDTVKYSSVAIEGANLLEL